jgi:hypothetical protein
MIVDGIDDLMDKGVQVFIEKNEETKVMFLLGINQFKQLWFICQNNKLLSYLQNKYKQR